MLFKRRIYYGHTVLLTGQNISKDGRSKNRLFDRELATVQQACLQKGVEIEIIFPG